jgi:hypothetical protein
MPTAASSGRREIDPAKFSEVSALVYLLYKVTNASTFENLYTFSGKRPMMKRSLERGWKVARC